LIQNKYKILKNKIMIENKAITIELIDEKYVDNKEI
jgi:hypothetical protein